MANAYYCDSLSRKDIRELANDLRAGFNIPYDAPFPVLKILEILPNVYSKLNMNWVIVGDKELPEQTHAEYDPYSREIRIKEFVYNGACLGNGRDLMTILHEISHFLLLTVVGIKFYRSFGKDVLPYNDPEWQAKCLAGELMMPAEAIRGMTPKEVSKKYHVSVQAATYQLSKL